jgi:hypothetical protein
MLEDLAHIDGGSEIQHKFLFIKLGVLLFWETDV